MTWLTRAAFVAALGAVACGSDDGVEGDADAAFEPFGCSTLPGDPVTTETSLGVGYLDDNTYVELADNDQTPLVKGRQGLYMLVVQLRIQESPPAESFCLSCVRQVSAAGAFAGLDQTVETPFDLDGSEYATNAALILGGGSDIESSLDGADVELSITCEGHGIRGSVTRPLTLFIPPEL